MFFGIAIYDFNHFSFIFSGFIRHNTDQIWWHCSVSICQVTNIQNILFPNVPWHCTHWCRSWSHLPTCSSQLRRYSSTWIFLSIFIFLIFFIWCLHLQTIYINLPACFLFTLMVLRALIWMFFRPFAGTSLLTFVTFF